MPPPIINLSRGLADYNDAEDDPPLIKALMPQSDSALRPWRGRQ